MSIKTNHSTESLTPDSGVLTISAEGALKLPIGTTEARPLGQKGLVRFIDSSVAIPEYHDGETWQEFADKSYVESRLGVSGSSIGDVIANLSLDDLTDVAITNPVSGQVLAYDLTSGLFKAQTQTIAPISKSFIADGVAMVFDLETSVSSLHSLVVSINGVQQEPYYSYTLINGNLLAFDEAPELNDRLQVKILRSNSTSDRPRPKITSITYSSLSNYATITIEANDITYGTGVKIGEQNITRIDYINSNTMQVMIENAKMSDVLWSSPQDLTIIDTSGNEFVFRNLINYSLGTKPSWTSSASYIGTFSGGNSINFQLPVNNAVTITINPAYAGESAISWLSISGSSIVGTAPQNSSPSRYEISITVSNGSVDITKNFWLLVV